MPKRTKRYLPPDPHSGTPQPDAEKQARAKRLMISLIFNSVVIVSVYFVLNALEFHPVFFIYMTIAAVLVVAYVIYNRGFVYKNATPEMLPDTLPYEERVQILAEARERMDSSRWMLTLILPFLIAFMVDALYLFILSDLLGTLGWV